MIDILQTVTGDLDMTGGDIHYGECTLMHQADILIARPGEYRLNINGTVGIEDYLDDETPDDLQNKIKIKIAADGMKVNSVVGADGKYKLNASYE
jgi:hypothetical protein